MKGKANDGPTQRLGGGVKYSFGPGPPDGLSGPCCMEFAVSGRTRYTGISPGACSTAHLLLA